ncbi:MAG: excinuclease ABC subunit UvrC [Methanomicrobiales archaeon]|nr:excinuclease ABC subunit UvrC [Methanomicrobiales archaeon]
MNPPGPLPDAPGCYIFRDASNTVIYVGKAKNLRKRVDSYFTRRETDGKTAWMVGLISDVDCIVTTNEVEALILENSLIKANQPRFNINLRDAKQYAFIHLTREEYPRICIARRMGDEGAYFGPFTSAAERDQVLSVVKKTFRLRSCRTLRRKGCLRASLGTCSAPCRGSIGKDEYAELVRQASAVLKGRAPELVKSLRSEMEERARACDFERAILLRDQIHALEHLSRRQDVARRKETDEDVINFMVHGGEVCLMLFSVHRGSLVNKKEYIFDEKDDFLEEFLVQYYSENTPPCELILPVPPGKEMEEFLSLRKGGKVTVTVPRTGTKKRLLSLVRKNIEVAHFGDKIKLEELRERLWLEEVPRVIECFDISHLAGTDEVGSMVQFRDGRPDRRHYRRFRIRSVEGIDDPAAIAEVVRRRYSRQVKEGGALPDLIVIDGGITQLRAARSTLDELGLDIPLISLAKGEEHIYTTGSSHPLSVKKHERASLFLQEIRDEAHRFAISYHRLLRSRKLAT